MNASEPYRVLFVCLGNICRSPAAEIIFKKMVPDPYYGGQEGFEHVVELLEDGCFHLLKELEKRLNV